MFLDLLFGAVLLLALFAVLDLMVGVSNDAVNFLNSSIGARAAPRVVIMIVASLGILAGVTFSSGMMEVARKGIFHPQLFTMPELITIFLAVMLTDVILLDLFNTFGLPTSTTVSIVFELLGAAVVVSLLKMSRLDGEANLGDYINTQKAIMIIMGILLSVVVAFVCGAIVQFITRLVFTFDYAKRLKRYGAVWGGIALASITYFILVKGAKGAAFLTPETLASIRANTLPILVAIFAVSAAALQVLLLFRFNILKPIVLIGTFALAMAFAANDLVNFIGVPMAGYHAYEAAHATAMPLATTMDALAKKVPTETHFLLLAGAIMVITLWLSKKARTVTETEIGLGQQEEGVERFESILLARVIVRMAIGFFDLLRRPIPRPVREAVARRLDPSHYSVAAPADDRPSFDMLRAGVNLMVASAVISYATSYKLPLSTTYVTFMVAMGSSFADMAWGRESAVYRVTGVLTVIGGWFMTAILALTISGTCAAVIWFTKGYGITVLLAAAGVAIWKNHHRHAERAKATAMDKIFNLRKVADVQDTVATTFEHVGLLLGEIRESLRAAVAGICAQNEYVLRAECARTRKVQRWTNIVVANIFKAMRLLARGEQDRLSYNYGQCIRRLQKLADGHRDIVIRGWLHVSNHHSPPLGVQVVEMRQAVEMLVQIFEEVEDALAKRQVADFERVTGKEQQLRELAEELDGRQIQRILDGSSKTRLSILFYAVLSDTTTMARQAWRLLEIFNESLARAAPPPGEQEVRDRAWSTD